MQLARQINRAKWKRRLIMTYKHHFKCFWETNKTWKPLCSWAISRACIKMSIIIQENFIQQYVLVHHSFLTLDADLYQGLFFFW